MLAMNNPELLKQAHQQIINQQKYQYERQKQASAKRAEMSEARGKYLEGIAKAGNVEGAEVIKQTIMQDPIYQGMPGIFGDLEQDFAAAKAMYGSGYGDMEVKDVIGLYTATPAVKAYNETVDGVKKIENLLKEDSATAHEGALKVVAKIIDPGIVTDSDRAAVANRGFGNIEALRNQIKAFKGGTLDEKMKAQVLNTAIALMGPRREEAFNVQSRMTPLLGRHSPEVVFASSGILGEDSPYTLADEPEKYEDDELNNLLRQYD
jgi:hypothetical protein